MFLNIQDGGWLLSFLFNISKTKHVTENLAADNIVTLKILIDKPKKKCRPCTSYLVCNPTRV